VCVCVCAEEWGWLCVSATKRSAASVSPHATNNAAFNHVCVQCVQLATSLLEVWLLSVEVRPETREGQESNGNAVLVSDLSAEITAALKSVSSQNSLSNKQQTHHTTVAHSCLQMLLSAATTTAADTATAAVGGDQQSSGGVLSKSSPSGISTSSSLKTRLPWVAPPTPLPALSGAAAQQQSGMVGRIVLPSSAVTVTASITKVN
jgi:hypothetical protein